MAAEAPNCPLWRALALDRPEPLPTSLNAAGGRYGRLCDVLFRWSEITEEDMKMRETEAGENEGGLNRV